MFNGGVVSRAIKCAGKYPAVLIFGGRGSGGETLSADPTEADKSKIAEDAKSSMAPACLRAKGVAKQMRG